MGVLNVTLEMGRVGIGPVTATRGALVGSLKNSYSRQAIVRIVHDLCLLLVVFALLTFSHAS